jgi:hypothetical protein
VTLLVVRDVRGDGAAGIAEPRTEALEVLEAGLVPEVGPAPVGSVVVCSTIRLGWAPSLEAWLPTICT